MAKSELSRPVEVENLGLRDFTLDITPSEAELTALAVRLKVDVLDALSAHATVKLLPNNDVRLNASFDATLTQTCVVTLEPVQTRHSSEFSVLYSHDVVEEDGTEDDELSLLDEEDELPDLIVDGKIDVGEAVIEHLALEIDPFPRVKDATFDGYSTDPDGVVESGSDKKNPFAVLAKLKETSQTSK